MIMYLSNPIPDQGRYEEFKGRLTEVMNTYINHTRSLLNSIKNKITSVRNEYDSDMVNKSIEIINEFSEKVIVNNYDRDFILKHGKESGKNVEILLQEIKKIQISLRTYFACDPVKVVYDVLKSASAELDSNNIVLKELSLTGQPSNLAHITSDDLRTIIEELITNASYAMKDSISKVLIIKIEKQDEKTIIDIRDTGKGISQENFEKVFSREFSSKAGGGFGLYYIKRTFEKYGAKIYVLGSEIGKGTTFRIELKSVN